MINPPLSVHIMTASFVPGDAIGNYMLTSANLWSRWGAQVRLYADSIAPSYADIARPSSFYPGAGDSLLWYHYSIYSENINSASLSPDLKVMDFHGVAPPDLYAKYNKHLSHLCQKALDLLPELVDAFDYFVVHSNYTRQQLIAHGFDPQRIFWLPLCVDTERYNIGEDDSLSTLLARVEYFLFVGRIVPQKDILAMLEIFSRIHQHHSDIGFILVGDRQLTPGYQNQLNKAINHLGLTKHVIFTDQVNNPAVLSALFRNAKLLFVTSEWETFCVPLVEAMFFGTPSVVHKIPPLPEVVDDSGIIIDKLQPDLAAQAVLTILDDVMSYESLSRAANRRAASFTEEALGRELLSTLAKMTEVRL